MLRNGPLVAQAGSNGVFRYGGGFPTDSYAATNYWVDPVFDTTVPPDTTPPVVSAQTPLAGASSVAATAAPTATFATAIDPTTAGATIRDAAGVSVPAVVSVDAARTVVTVTPSGPLVRGAAYSVSVSARSASGVAMAAPSTWSFTVAQPSPAAGVCPCSVWDDAAVPQTVSVPDQASVELGVRVTADSDGVVSGVRFYKGPQNTGVHTGSLWSSSGQLLATATFTGESSTGWQTVTFSTPVAVTAGATYVASYHAPVGYYSATSGQFGGAGVDAPPLHVLRGGGAYAYGSGGFPSNGSDANYWVDVVYNRAPGGP